MLRAIHDCGRLVTADGRDLSERYFLDLDLVFFMEIYIKRRRSEARKTAEKWIVSVFVSVLYTAYFKQEKNNLQFDVGCHGIFGVDRISEEVSLYTLFIKDFELANIK